MKKLTATTIICMALSTSVTASVDRRPIDLHITASKPLEEVQTCLTRYWQRRGRVTPMPIEGGVSLDYQITGPISASHAISIELRQVAGKTDITASYQHPWAASTVERLLLRSGRTCFPDAVAVAQ